MSRVSPGPGHVSRVSSSPPHSDISGSAASSSLSLNNIRCVSNQLISHSDQRGVPLLMAVSRNDKN